MAVFGGVTVTYIFLEFEHLETGFNDLEADPEMYCSLTTSDHESWQYTSVLPWLAIRTQFYLTEASEKGSWRGVSFRLLDSPLHVQWRAILSFFNFSQSIAEVPKKAGRSWSHSALPWDGRAGGVQTLLLRRCAPGAYVQQKFSNFIFHNFILLKSKLVKEEISPLWQPGSSERILFLWWKEGQRKEPHLL